MFGTAQSELAFLILDKSKFRLHPHPGVEPEHSSRMRNYQAEEKWADDWAT